MNKAELEVFHFDCKDIITTSSDFDHDNGFIDIGDLARAAKDLINKLK